MTFTDIVKKVLRDLELSEEQIDRMYLNAMAKTPIQDCKVPEDRLLEVENWIRVFMAEHLVLLELNPEEFERREALYKEGANKLNGLN